MSKRTQLAKLISLIATVAMIGVFLPAAMVEAADLDALTVESITNHQPKDMITESLTLDQSYEWSAVPAGVINTQTGAVTRDVAENKSVTLTATSGASQKSFSLVVKSKKTKVGVSDDFAYNYESTVNAVAQSDFVFAGYENTVSHVIEKESDGNHYLLLDWTSTEETKKSSKPIFLRNKVNLDSGKVYVTFKYKYVKGSATSEIVNIKIKNGGTDYVAAAHLSTWNSSFGLRSPNYWDGGCLYSNYKADGTDEWKTAKIRYDVATGKVEIADDASAFSEKTTLSTTGAAFTDFYITPGSLGADSGKLYIDDFMIYTESLDNLTSADRQELIDSALDIENITSSVTGALTEYDNLNLSTALGLVEWQSSDSSVILINGETGTVKSYGGDISKPVMLTATYEGGTRKYNFAAAPNKFTTTSIAGGKLAEDFENGTAGESIEIPSAASHSVRTGWGKLSGDTLSAPTFKYYSDTYKGMVGSLSGNAGEKTSLSLLAGAQGAAQRFLTSFDVKVTEGSFELEMNSVLPYEKVVISANSINVYTDNNVVKTFNINPNESGWVRVDIDTNWAARSQNVYVDGVALSDMPMKNMIYTTMNQSSIGGALSWIDITLGEGAQALIDNIAVTSYININTALADAGVKAAQLFYSDKEIAAKTLESYGPSEHNGGAYDITSSFENQNGSTKKAALTWSGDGVEGFRFNPANIGEYTLTVSATSSGSGYGQDTKTGTVKVKAAPAVINKDNGKVSVAGATTGGMLIIAQYDGNGKFTNALIYKDNFDSIDAPNGDCRYFFFKEGTIVPLALSK